MVHLGEIVIVCRKPKDGHGIHAGSRGLFRQSHCGERFVDRKHRAAEESDLLPGNNRSRTTPEAG